MLHGQAEGDGLLKRLLRVRSHGVLHHKDRARHVLLAHLIAVFANRLDANLFLFREKHKDALRRIIALLGQDGKRLATVHIYARNDAAGQQRRVSQAGAGASHERTNALGPNGGARSRVRSHDGLSP
jgi:hypothetical protein